jgi:hypothetical protein
MLLVTAREKGSAPSHSASDRGFPRWMKFLSFVRIDVASHLNPFHDAELKNRMPTALQQGKQPRISEAVSFVAKSDSKLSAVGTLMDATPLPNGLANRVNSI